MADSNRKGVFLLSDVRQRSLDGYWDTYQTNTQFGWFGGGSGQTVRIDRIDFSNDSVTASIRGSLQVGKSATGSTGNANYGWFGGGYTPTVINSVERIDYANDSPTSTSIRGPLSQARYLTTAAGNANYGWWFGGYAPGSRSTIDRINFSNDSPTVASNRGPLPISIYFGAAAANANYGWYIGGNNPGITSVYRIDFSNDSPTSAGVRGSINTARGGHGAVGNSNYGWIGGGGLTGATPSFVSTVERIDYANDSVIARIRGPLTLAKSKIQAAAGNTNYGWFGGGYASTTYSSVDRIDFSNDSPTSATPRGPLSLARSNSSAVSGIGVYRQYPGSTQQAVNPTVAGYGWWAGGYVAGSVASTVDRVDFSNDSPTFNIRGSLDIIAAFGGALSNGNYGWWVAGRQSLPTPVALSNVSRIDFSNDSPTTALARSSLLLARSYVSAASNFNYGWVSGGLAPPATVLSRVDRIDYSNDIIAPVVRGPLAVASLGLAATGNANYGWFGGGTTAIPANATSIVSRIDYSNDSPTAASPRGVLSAARYEISATGNANYGWFAGGVTPTASSVVDRIDFSNDSPTAASPRGPLSLARTRIAAAGNANYGWFGGGLVGGTSYSTIDRVDFSNDSPTAASPRGPLSNVKYAASATSNYIKPSLNRLTLDQRFIGGNISGTYGWIGGGITPTTISSVDRIDFSNDSPTAASPRGTLSVARRDGTTTATANSNYGWFMGGVDASNAQKTTVDRINFANDSPTTASPRGSLNFVKTNASATGNANYGWIAGGTDNPATISTIDRIDYANDLSAPSTRGLFAFGGPAGAFGQSATANSNYGWWGGGYQGSVPATYSTITRVDFSNDSPASTTTRGPLSQARYGTIAVSNNNYGWWASGFGYTLIDRIDFSNDSPTSATARGPLSVVRYTGMGFSNGNYGWFGGGQPINSSIDRIDFSNDSPTGASLRGNMTAAKYRFVGGASNFVKTNAIPNISQYPVGSGVMGAVSGTYGWWGGGGIGPAGPTTSSSVDRIDFSNDSPTAASPRGPINGRYTHSAASNTAYGWFGGGATVAGGGGNVSTVDRIDFSNDSPGTASIRGPLAAVAYRQAASGNANYGFWIAGVFGSMVYRVDYSNDSPTAATTRGPLSTSRNTMGATSNGNFIWVGGGQDNGTSADLSSVDRINISNDSPTASSTRGSLTLARYSASAMSNASYGWFTGGNGGGSPRGTVDRVDFSNDSPTLAIARGPLSQNPYGHATASNPNYGWIAGNTYPGTTIVDRIDFSNDSPTSSSQRGPISITRSFVAAVGNK